MLLLGPEDRVLVVEANRATWSNLLVDEGLFKATFERQPTALAA